MPEEPPNMSRAEHVDQWCANMRDKVAAAQRFTDACHAAALDRSAILGLVNRLRDHWTNEGAGILIRQAADRLEVDARAEWAGACASAWETFLEETGATEA